MAMTPADRFDWIESYLREEGSAKGCVDVCDAAFVDAYETATGATVQITNYGANKCPQLGRDLATMAKAYRLKRARCGLEGMAGMGFPRWVWLYRLYPHLY